MTIYNSIKEANLIVNKNSFADIALLAPHYFQSFPVPYETIMNGTPQTHTYYGRIYDIDLYQVEGKAVTYNELRSLRGKAYAGIMLEDKLVLVEVFSDYGEDGHVDYVLKGVALMSKNNEDVKKLLDGTYFNVG
ncbi:MAG: hypothetical protein ABFC98_03120 [Candidatus Cloacimonas sp.]